MGESVNCYNGKHCNISLVWQDTGDCLQYQDCPSFPCYTHNCTQIPIDLPAYCETSLCWSDPHPDPPHPDPSSNNTLTLVICTIIPLIIIIGLLVFYKKRNRNQPQPLNNDDDEVNDDDEGNGMVSPRMSAIQDELDRPYPRIEHAGNEYFTVASSSDDDDYGPIVRPRQDAYD